MTGLISKRRSQRGGGGGSRGGLRFAGPRSRGKKKNGEKRAEKVWGRHQKGFVKGTSQWEGSENWGRSTQGGERKR